MLSRKTESMDNQPGVIVTADQINWLGERGFQLIREHKPAEADALWAEWGLLEFFVGTD